MPARRKHEPVPCLYFTWMLGLRNSVYYADGRSNAVNVGRHSLGTRDRKEAMQSLAKLDLVQAVKAGLADRNLLHQDGQQLLTITEGRTRYLEYCGRSPIQGGLAPNSFKSYRTAMHIFEEFAKEHRIEYWNQVTRDVLTRYLKYLNESDYHDKTQYDKVTHIRTALNWFTEEGLLPRSCIFSLKLKKPQGTRTYCYTEQEVQAILALCRSEPELAWMGDVVLLLARTGLRIGELAALRWNSVDLEQKLLHLRDESRNTRQSERSTASRTKSHRSRVIPLHPDVVPVLERLPRLADQRVIHGPRGGKIKPDTFRRILIRDVLKSLAPKFPANANGPGIASGRLHSFRHYFVSTAVTNGVPEQVLMAWVGHKDSDMVRHYFHLAQEHSRRFIERLPSLGGGAVSRTEETPEQNCGGGTKGRTG